MLKDCYLECWFRTNVWNDVSHSHGHLHIDNISCLPDYFIEKDGKIEPHYSKDVGPIKWEPIYMKLAAWYGTPKILPNGQAAEMRTISHFDVRVWQLTGQPDSKGVRRRQLLLYIRYEPDNGWMPIILHI